MLSACVGVKLANTDAPATIIEIAVSTVTPLSITNVNKVLTDSNIESILSFPIDYTSSICGKSTSGRLPNFLVYADNSSSSITPFISQSEPLRILILRRLDAAKSSATISLNFFLSPHRKPLEGKYGAISKALPSKCFDLSVLDLPELNNSSCRSLVRRPSITAILNGRLLAASSATAIREGFTPFAFSFLNNFDIIISEYVRLPSIVQTQTP